MNDLVIAVTGIHATDSPAPGVAVLRSLRLAFENTRFIGFSYGVLDSGNFMRNLVDASYLVPYANTGPQALLERIQQIHEREKINIIFPTLDSELENYLIIYDELLKSGIRMLLPTRDSLKMRDKSGLSKYIPDDVVLLPMTLSVNDAGGLQKIFDEMEFPLFIKGQYYEAYIAHTQAEATGWFYRLASQWGIPVIVQKMIQGEECNVCVLAHEGKLLGLVAMKKLFLTDKGKAWAGVTIKNPELEKISSKLLERLNWSGGAEFEFIIEAGTRDIYLLEMNPRFPAWLWLATSSGINMPAMQVQISLGKTVEPILEYEAGQVFVRHSWDEIVPMSSIEALSTGGEVIYT
jgi:carbamoyl-phosphate synthase large subunit